MSDVGLAKANWLARAIFAIALGIIWLYGKWPKVITRERYLALQDKAAAGEFTVSQQQLTYELQMLCAEYESLLAAHDILPRGE